MEEAMQSSRELVYRTLNFAGPERVPRQLWYLPWAEYNFPEQFARIRRDFPDDIVISPGFEREPPRVSGQQYEAGEFIDAWGCKFINIHRGVIGEVKEPLIKGDRWEDRDVLRLPTEYLTVDRDRVNDFCRGTDRFVLGNPNVNPFERMQFIRSSERLYLDLAVKSREMREVLAQIHDFFCRLFTLWAETEVDGLMFADDWGAQRGLLINPKVWREIFKPLYRDYIEIAHSHGKKAFMHSDGDILEIMPDLIDLGLDALNSQIFCIGLEKLTPFRGKITFWGELDRQWLLPHGSRQDIEHAVRAVKRNLWANGGCIAQCEFSAGTNPDNVYAAFEVWNKILDEG
jgi:uroporphyrinogen decarboxylase